MLPKRLNVIHQLKKVNNINTTDATDLVQKIDYNRKKKY